MGWYIHVGDEMHPGFNNHYLDHIWPYDLFVTCLKSCQWYLYKPTDKKRTQPCSTPPWPRDLDAAPIGLTFSPRHWNIKTCHIQTSGSYNEWIPIRIAITSDFSIFVSYVTQGSNILLWYIITDLFLQEREVGRRNISMFRTLSIFPFTDYPWGNAGIPKNLPIRTSHQRNRGLIILFHWWFPGFPKRASTTPYNKG